MIRSWRLTGRSRSTPAPDSSTRNVGASLSIRSRHRVRISSRRMPVQGPDRRASRIGGLCASASIAARQHLRKDHLQRHDGALLRSGRARHLSELAGCPPLAACRCPLLASGSTAVRGRIKVAELSHTLDPGAHQAVRAPQAREHPVGPSSAGAQDGALAGDRFRFPMTCGDRRRREHGAALQRMPDDHPCVRCSSDRGRGDDEDRQEFGDRYRNGCAPGWCR